MNNISGWLMMASAIVAQTALPADWSHMASLPFAFAAASFLIWSMVQLFRCMFDSWKQQSADMIETLQTDVAGLRLFQTDTLVGLLQRVTSALEHDAEAWEELHEDFKELAAAVRKHPCVHDSDLPKLNGKALSVVEHRQQRSKAADE
jgi:hypothetical protein